MHRPVAFRIILAALIIVGLTPATADVGAQAPLNPTSSTGAPATPSTASASAPRSSTPSTTPAIALTPREGDALAAAVAPMVGASGAAVGVTVVELGGSDPIAWSLDGSTVITAASTYKLVALMMEAENIANGNSDPNGLVCFEDEDYEAGWFDDYSVGECYTRNELATRAAKQSDNTAGHMLVRDVGGADALNTWAASIGATSSNFFDGNTTTSEDLAVLWLAEADGSLGGAAAQAWLYPLLTGTTTESGVPAGVPGGVTVIHKTGTIDAVDNDAALVTGGPGGSYVLVVMTDGLGGDAGWQLIASVSATVWQFEASRPL